MRGKENGVLHMDNRIRITPAYAGKSQPFQFLCRSDQDHPRLCGEKHVFLRYGHMFLGSPPPMRGKDMTTKSEIGIMGITPAYAGKSRCGILIFR